MNDRISFSEDLVAVSGGKSPAQNDRNLTAAASAHSSNSTYQSYTSRWFMLFLFVMYSTSNAFQWTQLVIITNILEKYYQVETIYVSWTSMIYMATYIPLIFPATWFLQKKVSTLQFC